MNAARDPRSIPTRLQSRYRIDEVIGSGGMSTVYRAHDSLLNRDVAVKIFALRAIEEEDLRVQQAEAQLAASLNHHALTSLFDAGVDSSDPARPQIYLVMEYIPGLDLRKRLAHGPLNSLQVGYLGFDLAEGLDHVHQAGFVHHDIKPANVLLADRDAATRPRGKLTDFGIATIIGKTAGSEFTTGTAAYLAPEQVEGEEATPASDVYSLGLVLLEALSGVVAFPGTVEESAFARLDRDPVIPAHVPDVLAAILRDMTARLPAHRPPLTEIASRFQTFIVDRLVEARTSPPDRVVVDEAERAAAARRYNVLEAPPVDAFDTVNRLAVQILDVPIAVVSIFDSDQIWLQSRPGIDLQHIDRTTAFCVRTDPRTGTAWTISDMRSDERLLGNPLVHSAPHVRSCAAAPLLTRDGHHLGALCVFDTRIRDFDRSELANLTDLAGIVTRELELRLSSRRAIFGGRDR